MENRNSLNNEIWLVIHTIEYQAYNKNYGYIVHSSKIIWESYNSANNGNNGSRGSKKCKTPEYRSI